MGRRVRFIQATDGEWLQPYQKGWKMACCDCGLVHTIDFRITKGMVELRAKRNKRLTNLKRKEMKKPKPNPNQNINAI